MLTLVLMKQCGHLMNTEGSQDIDLITVNGILMLLLLFFVVLAGNNVTMTEEEDENEADESICAPGEIQRASTKIWGGGGWRDGLERDGKRHGGGGGREVSVRVTQ